jgi:DegV family protein with EDD domain
MAGIAVVTDSSACLPAELLRAHNIVVVPLAVLVDGASFSDSEIDPADFARRLRTGGEYPTSAAPAPGEFLNAFRQARREGAEAVLCLTLSARYSGTHGSAVKAKELAESELPGFPVRIVDTGGIAMAHGFAVLEAAVTAGNDGRLEEVAAVAERTAAASNLVGVLDGTRFLAKSGRVPRIVDLAATALGIRPVIASTHGKIGAAGRVRTIEQGIEKLVQFVGERTDGVAPVRIGVMHAGAQESAQELERRVREEFAGVELLEAEFTAAMALHTGPGFLGLAWQMPQAGLEMERPRLSPARRRDMETLAATLGSMPPAVEQPPLLMLSGLPGSGKSYLARGIASRYPLAVLESDALRKALVERPTYSRTESTRLFGAVHALAEDLLRRGVPVLLDATNLKEAHREPLYAIAERTGSRLVVVVVSANEDLVRRRLAVRRAGEDPQDKSEATVEVFEMMRAEAEPIERSHITVDGSDEMTDAAVALIVRELEGTQG